MEISPHNLVRVVAEQQIQSLCSSDMKRDVELSILQSSYRFGSSRLCGYLDCRTGNPLINRTAADSSTVPSSTACYRKITTEEDFFFSSPSPGQSME